MGPDVTVQWEAPASPEAQRSLAEWAEARGVRLKVPAAGRPRPIPRARVTAEPIEEAIEHARDAVSAEDGPAADQALATATTLLDAHPELPQAAWLRAEVERTRGMRRERIRPRVPRRGAADWARAAGLDGGRAAGVGEDGTPGRLPTVTVHVTFTGQPTPARVRVDGVRLVGATLVATPGEHQLTVADDEGTILASWVTVEAGRDLVVALPAPGSCSAEDVGRAHVAAGSVDAEDVQCPSWVYVRASDAAPAALSLATCAGDRCGPLFHWQVGAMGPVLPPSRASSGWPAWATWALIGGSAVAVGVATLAAAGSFRPTHDEPTFSTGGLHPASRPLPLRLAP